jgi:hypothetical protein
LRQKDLCAALVLEHVSANTLGKVEVVGQLCGIGAVDGPMGFISAAGDNRFLF